MTDGSITFSTELDNGDLEKELARLKKKVLRLEEDLTVGTSKKNALAEKLKLAREEYKKLQADMTVSGGGKIVRSDETLSQMLELGNTIKETEAAIKKQNRALEETQMKLDGVKARYGEVAREASKLQSPQTGQGGGAASAADQAANKMESVIARMRALVSEGANSIKLGLLGIANGFKRMAQKGISAVGGLSKSIASLMKDGLKKLIAYSGKAAKSLLSLIKGSNKANGSFASGIKTMLKYSLGIRSLYALVNKLRSALTEGFKNLAQYSDTTNKSISMVMSALTQLKNSLATAFAPILTTVAPILTQFINMLSTAADYVARLTAALTGQTSYTRAVAVQEDYAASLENTASAADDAAGSLAGFDEINTIATENTASASGSSGSVSPSEMFEEVAIEPLSFDSWGEAFSAMLDSILNNGIPKLKEAFSSFANWLNGFSANLYETFTFPGVQDKVALLGSELAASLNGLVNQIDWATMGGALGAGLNTALGFLVSFIYTFDWLNLGASLATMANHAIAEIDWYAFGQLLWAKFKIALETLAGFLLNLDMKQLAESASNIVKGFFNSMTETLQNIDWFALGEQVKEFLINVDWAGVAESVFTAIGAAFGAAVAFLWGLIHDAWEQVINWWYDVAFEDGKFTITGLLEGIWEVIKSIGTWIYDHIFLPFINGFKSVFGIHSPSTVMAEMGVYIMQGLLNGVTSMISSVVSVFSTLWSKIQDVFAHISDWFKDKFSAAWQTVKDVFSSGGEIFDGIKDGILEGLKAVINALISGINKVISVPFNGINSALKTIKSVDILGIKPFSWINTISIPQIPALATGAVIPPNREFLAVLGDQTSGNNIEAPEGLIRQIVREEAGGNDNTALLQAILEAIKAGKVMMVDKRVLARVAAEGINDLTVAAGKPVLLI